MGVSLINLQVHTGDRPEAAVHAAIAATYRRLLAAAGFVPLADGEDEHDWTLRDIFIAPAAGTPGVGVCDIHAAWEDPLRALAAALSAARWRAAKWCATISTGPARHRTAYTRRRARRPLRAIRSPSQF